VSRVESDGALDLLLVKVFRAIARAEANDASYNDGGF
jgi:hypothetical protein